MLLPTTASMLSLLMLDGPEEFTQFNACGFFIFFACVKSNAALNTDFMSADTGMTPPIQLQH